MAVSVAPFLADFAAFARHQPHPEPALRNGVDIEARLEQAKREAHAAGEAAAEVRCEQMLADERARSAAAMAEARAEWAKGEGQRLAEGLVALDGQLRAALAEMLAPLLPDMVRAKIIDDLAGAAETLLKPGGPALVEVSGPVEMLDALRARLGDRGPAVEYWPTAGVDVRLVADHTIVETNFGPWLDRLREAIA